MATPQVLRDNAPYHSILISSIAELDYVPSALSHQTAYVDDMQTRLKRSEARLKKLSETTMKERKEHESLRDSTARRLAHKLTGRKEQFEAMETKEEREYVEALEKEFTERDTHNLLISMAEEATREKADLAEKAIRYQTLKKELSELYVRVFDGPTEEYPEDDRLEHKLQSTQALHDQIQNTLNSECRACEILANADRTMNACEAQVKEALAHSQRDMWGGSRLHDVWERNALSIAQALARQTQSLYQQAQNVSPFVQSIGPLTIAQGSLLGDMFFSDIFSDTAYHRKIAASAADLQRAHGRLREERDAAQRRANNAGTQLIEVAQTLEVQRLELDSYRREVFQGISREVEASSSDRPPSYYAASAQPGVSLPTATTPIGAPSTPVQNSTRTMVSSPEPTQMSPSSPPIWGMRNPYAATLAIRSRPPSYDQS